MFYNRWFPLDRCDLFFDVVTARYGWTSALQQRAAQGRCQVMAQHSPQQPVRWINRKPNPQREKADRSVPELGVEVKHGADGSTDVQTSARGIPAILAYAAVLIMLTVVTGFVVMAAMMRPQHEAPVSRETHALVDRGE